MRPLVVGAITMSVICYIFPSDCYKIPQQSPDLGAGGMHAVRVRYEGNKGPHVNMDIAATMNVKTPTGLRQRALETVRGSMAS